MGRHAEMASLISPATPQAKRRTGEAMAERLGGQA